MKCDVFDTYVTKPDGQLMHFDIIVPNGIDEEAVLAYGRVYLATVGVPESGMTAKQCRFCHVEQANPAMQSAIEKQGYFILAMEGCPPATIHNENGGLL